MHPCETLNKLMFVTDMIDDALEVSWFCVLTELKATKHLFIEDIVIKYTKTLKRIWSPAPRDENGTDIFRPYSKPNPFRGV